MTEETLDRVRRLFKNYKQPNPYSFKRKYRVWTCIPADTNGALVLVTINDVWYLGRNGITLSYSRPFIPVLELRKFVHFWEGIYGLDSNAVSSGRSSLESPATPKRGHRPARVYHVSSADLANLYPMLIADAGRLPRWKHEFVPSSKSKPFEVPGAEVSLTEILTPDGAVNVQIDTDPETLDERPFHSK